MFREIRRHEKITDKFEEKEKGFMQIKPLNPEISEMSMDEIQAFITKELQACHEHIMKTMSD